MMIKEQKNSGRGTWRKEFSTSGSDEYNSWIFSVYVRVIYNGRKEGCNA